MTHMHTFSKAPLDEGSARRRDIYLYQAHKTHNRQTSMPPAGPEPTKAVSEWQQTSVLQRACHFDRRRIIFTQSVDDLNKKMCDMKVEHVHRCGAQLCSYYLVPLILQTTTKFYVRVTVHH